MKKVSLFAASLMLCCGLFTNASAQKTASCGADVTNLRVTLQGNPNDPNNTYKLLSDRFNFDGTPVPYQSQKIKGDTIEAMLQIDNCSQDFTMNLYFSKRVMKVYLPSYPNLSSSTFFNFDRVASVPVTPVNAAGCDPTVSGSCAATDWVSASQFCTNGAQKIDGFVVAKNDDGTYRDNYAGCAIDADGRAYVRRTVGIQLPDNYRLRFQNSPIDGGGTLAAGTSYIKVYHYAADTANNRPERWELTPEEITNEGTTGAWGALIFQPNRGAAYRVGYHLAPLHITVEKP